MNIETVCRYLKKYMTTTFVEIRKLKKSLKRCVIFLRSGEYVKGFDVLKKV